MLNATCQVDLEIEEAEAAHLEVVAHHGELVEEVEVVEGGENQAQKEGQESLWYIIIFMREIKSRKHS